MRILRSSKRSKANRGSAEQPVELTQKLATKTISTQSWYSYVPTFLVSWSCLKLPVQVQHALHPHNSFLMNNCNMTANCAEKHSCCVEFKIPNKH